MPKVVPEYKEMARTRIIAAAVKIFSEKGYHDSTMDEIAEEVGVSKATLYTYFKSKEDILKVIWVSSNQKMAELQKSFKGRDCLEVLEEVYDMMNGELYLAFELLALSSHNEGLRQINRAAYDEKLEISKAFLKDQQDRGKIRNDLDVSVIAQALTALYTDAAAQLLMGVDAAAVHEKWKKSVAAILEIGQ